MYKVTLQSNALAPLPSAATLIAGGVSALKATAAETREAQPRTRGNKEEEKRRRFSVDRHTGGNPAAFGQLMYRNVF